LHDVDLSSVCYAKAEVITGNDETATNVATSTPPASRRRNYNAASVTALFVPITICMLFVVVSIKVAHCKTGAQNTYMYACRLDLDFM